MHTKVLPELPAHVDWHWDQLVWFLGPPNKKHYATFLSHVFFPCGSKSPPASCDPLNESQENKYFPGIYSNTLFKLNLLWLFHWVNTYDVKKINVISRRCCGFGNAKVVFTASSHFHFIFFLNEKYKGERNCVFLLDIVSLPRVQQVWKVRSHLIFSLDLYHSWFQFPVLPDRQDTIKHLIHRGVRHSSTGYSLAKRDLLLSFEKIMSLAHWYSMFYRLLIYLDRF